MGVVLTNENRGSSRRAAIVAVLRDHDEFRPAQSIHDELRRQGVRVGLATVYRTLQVMHRSGEVDALRLENEPVAYRLCSDRKHHHHLVCRVCGRTVEVDDPTVERWIARVAAEHGYRDVSHVLEVLGVCGAH